MPRGPAMETCVVQSTVFRALFICVSLLSLAVLFKQMDSKNGPCPTVCTCAETSRPDMMHGGPLDNVHPEQLTPLCEEGLECDITATVGTLSSGVFIGVIIACLVFVLRQEHVSLARPVCGKQAETRAELVDKEESDPQNLFETADEVVFYY
ncbi:uncharacterized protein LOC144864396 [Branchiostoma floridae x Branchiostoma japonicum]